jgi:hypothetical protein
MALDPQVSSIDPGMGKQSVSPLSPGRYSRKQLRAILHRNMARMMRYVSLVLGGHVIMKAEYFKDLDDLSKYRSRICSETEEKPCKPSNRR